MKEIDSIRFERDVAVRINEMHKFEISNLKEKNRILQEKLDNATETIRHLNKKLAEYKGE